ncbi:polysaccharide biosynthesis protein [Microbacterium gilvum]|uniref:Polysaccharide biosynthesis protein n=1 Tax=Microbacterium gilvum TaxID=1336204 RepID=A0ABP9AAD8_9MICO
MSLARRLLSFSTIPAVSALVPFLILPIVARVGDDAWVGVAVGQSVGGFCALVVGLGLNIVGPTLVASAPASERADLFATGTRARLLASAPAAAIAAVAAALLAPATQTATAAVMAVAIALGGLSASWYLVGVGRPLPLIAYELAPRALATAAGGVVILLGGEVLWYPALLLAAILGGLGAFAVSVVRPGRLLGGGWRGSLAFARVHLPAAATETVSGAYTSLAVTLVTAGTTTAQAAGYVSGDKLFRMGQTVIGAQGNALQGWVVEDGMALLGGRARRALVMHAVLGILGFAAFALLGPWLTSVLFADQAMDEATAILFGVAVLCISLTTSLGRHALVPLGRTKAVFASVVAGAVVGVPTTLVLSALWGSVGGAAGLASAELVVLLVQIALLVGARKKAA